MFELESTGDFKKTEAALRKMASDSIFASLDRGGAAGVAALRAATPVDSGNTAAGWYYEVKKTRGAYSITWMNRNVVNGFPVAIMLQYGHGTGTGGYVRGRNYINPAMKPAFDRIANEVWKAVTSA